MSVWTAVTWGAVTAASLLVGQALAGALGRRHQLTGLIMGFGAGTLLSAIAYQLVPDAGEGHGWLVGSSLALGALTYFFADRLIDRGGGANRQRIRATGAGGSGLAMFLGALLDGIPESFVLGIGMGMGETVSAAFVVAVFVSNVPEGVAGTTSMRAAGWSTRGITGLWGSLTVVCAVVAGLGFLSAGAMTNAGQGAEAFAAGAMLMVLADSMIPEAYTHGGQAVGLATVGGYLVATALAAAG
ncbi:membrane protein [Luedemannella flava]|uniref:Membrane protein n=1 Tax=Luedemannella flava TaxID=349316 RepID=A0ABP4XXX0_9ACTN